MSLFYLIRLNTENAFIPTIKDIIIQNLNIYNKNKWIQEKPIKLIMKTEFNTGTDCIESKRLRLP